MKKFDLERAERAIELIVDRDTEAGSRFRALLEDMWPDGRMRGPRDGFVAVDLVEPGCAPL
jgi:hypothetical protein